MAAMGHRTDLGRCWHLTKDPGGKKDEAVNATDLRVWLQEMVEWGRRVRLDIIRLEGAAGFPSGDPGDPPPEPE